MRTLALVALALLAVPATASEPAEGPEIVVKGDVRRLEIERILDADNVDTSRLGTRSVADAMAMILRGRAPEDFWQAYRAHVLAWQRLAEVEAAQWRQVSSVQGEAALVSAEQGIETSFDAVERIARRYGARLPTPPWKRLPTL